MSQQAVFADGRWNGKTLREWVSTAVGDVVREFNPAKVIVFGSVGRGDESPDSDLDLLVVFDEVDPGTRVDLMGAIRRAITAPIPCDVVVTDVAEFERKKDVNGTMFYWPSREGEVVYERAVA
ncbi:MAG: nucleotidyltransferase domain-containing protein [Actinobacteria bacterium]|nr:nucleotidyltransferase domain-containing protein [Actinomycetota bacterium]